MLRRIGGRVWMTGLALAVAGGLYLGAPPEPQAASAACGYFQGQLCEIRQDCVRFLFFRSCTTTYVYYYVMELI